MKKSIIKIIKKRKDSTFPKPDKSTAAKLPFLFDPCPTVVAKFVPSIPPVVVEPASLRPNVFPVFSCPALPFVPLLVPFVNMLPPAWAGKGTVNLCSKLTVGGEARDTTR